jgi:hypothetical protein
MTVQATPTRPEADRLLTKHPVRRLIGELDAHLSRSQGVKRFSDDERCLLRYATIPSPCRVLLSDGTEVKRGDPVVDIHCWNDRVPSMARSGPDIAWAQDTSRRFKESLRLLALALATQPDLAEAKACRAQVNFVGQGGSNASVSRIIRRMGFEDVDEGSVSLWTRVHHQFENLLIAALVWTHNPDALRRDKMVRERRPVWASRAQVLICHGPRSREA